MIEDDPLRRDIYMAGPDIVKPIPRHCGFELSEKALGLQRLASGVLALVDQTWDEDPGMRAPLLAYCERLAGPIDTDQTPPRGLHPLLIEGLSDLLSTVTPTQAREFVNKGVEITRLEERATTAGLHEYIKLRKQETRLMVDMLALIVPEEEQRHPRYGEYTRLLGSVAAVSVIIDSLEDLADDYGAGRTIVKPTRGNKRTMLGLAIKEGLKCVRELGPVLSAQLCMSGLRFGKSLMQAKRAQGISTGWPNLRTRPPVS